MQEKTYKVTGMMCASKESLSHGDSAGLTQKT